MEQRRSGHEEGGSRDAGRLIRELHEGKFAGPIDRYEEVELSLSGLHLGNVDVKEADRVGFELLLRPLVTVDIRQTPDAVTGQAAMQRGRVRCGMVACSA